MKESLLGPTKLPSEKNWLPELVQNEIQYENWFQMNITSNAIKKRHMFDMFAKKKSTNIRTDE